MTTAGKKKPNSFPGFHSRHIIIRLTSPTDTTDTPLTPTSTRPSNALESQCDNHCRTSAFKNVLIRFFELKTKTENYFTHFQKNAQWLHLLEPWILLWFFLDLRTPAVSASLCGHLHPAIQRHPGPPSGCHQRLNTWPRPTS